MCYLCKTPSGRLEYVLAKNTEIVDASSVDWEQRRYEIAKQILPAVSKGLHYDDAARLAVKYADALIDALKKKKEDEQ